MVRIHQELVLSQGIMVDVRLPVLFPGRMHSCPLVRVLLLIPRLGFMSS